MFDEIRWKIEDCLQAADRHLDREQYDKAARLLLEAVELHDQLGDLNADEKLMFRDHIAQRLFDDGRFTEAIELDDGTLVQVQFSSTIGPDHERTIPIRHRLACGFVAVGRIDDGIEQHCQNVKIWKNVVGDVRLASCKTYAALSKAYAQVNAPSEAAKMEALWVNVGRQWLPSGSDRMARTHLLTGITALEGGNFDIARTHFKQCQNFLSSNGSGDCEAGTFLCDLWLQRCQETESAYVLTSVDPATAKNALPAAEAHVVVSSSSIVIEKSNGASSHLGLPAFEDSAELPQRESATQMDGKLAEDSGKDIIHSVIAMDKRHPVTQIEQTKCDLPIIPGKLI